jgi:hypothetical protein
LKGRFGTKEFVRGNLDLTHAVAPSRVTGSGEVVLIGSWHDDAERNMMGAGIINGVHTDDITVDRLPVLKASFRDKPLPLRPLSSFSYRFGGAIGQYTEQPTDVSDSRGQIWGVVNTPRATFGSLSLGGEYGVCQAVYGNHDSHRAMVGMVSLETKATSDIYANFSFIHRDETGKSPFLFDRVVIPDELFTEVEFPIGKGSRWRLNLVNQQDLTAGKSRDFTATAIYNLDCFSYGLSYNTINGSLALGIVLNGFDSFRKGSRHVGFMQ